MEKRYTSMERVLTTMSKHEPDKVPLFLMCTHYCAKFLEMQIKNYFSKPENVAKGQMILLKKFNNDCLNPFYSAAHEYAAFGSEVIFDEAGAPNAGEPIIKNFDDILKLQLPDVKNSKILRSCLETISILKKEVGMSVPIAGGVLSPFSLPILQMGFDKYIELIYEKPELLNHLIKINERFCTEWANMQLRAGATFISYIDSMSVSSVIPKSIYLKTGFPSAKRTIPTIKSDVAIATSSASSASILEEILEAGIKAILVSHSDDLAEIKKKVDQRATLLGNLNGIEMCRWTRSDAEYNVREAIRKAGAGGGFILCDSLGDIPYQVSEDILYEISESVNKWGRYPLNWR
ncbi:uroporphyrinogen decarboxylase family protein [Clostridium beijerinckii]|uniref:uroporphyrinogen decarboxylase family protein n=1 Tax=Clostridium beijerinckii TaxID=1520 RepID=UPI00098BD587|nr:uroporphyrinogen decarboxylase family protein [Clostridium beijerinckii]MBA8937651.1 uroporphyrinogen decarboxylase [Clostridium beijerinckii]NRU41258.1 uroporphyrinogen decarboxylase [Clostridium beijerinckii]NSA95467.1 uroporphyrinogen decarboxylase [Clostridium beijerinckii]OOM53447.1 uroporphyrinogen decarboxylase [Clostridium beijerinckii]OOM65987.1 uroporphyrinogen decarboxylase [Clostridium beijerinckii]